MTLTDPRAASTTAYDESLVPPDDSPFWHLVRDGDTVTLSYDDGAHISLIAFPFYDALELAERLLRMVRDAAH